MKKLSSELILRAVAIIAVVGVHFLASLPSQIYTSAPWQPLTVLLDQLSRMSVPMFVALSGFGLSLKYHQQAFSWWSFLRRRVVRLLPLYILLSLIFYVVFWFLPSWRPSNTPTSFITQLIWGRADYHLYFVPMLFQLYLLYPILLRLVRRWPRKMLALSFGFQLALYAFFSAVENGSIANSLWSSDQQQYVWCISWIFYFVLGMYMAQVKFSPQLRYLTGLLAVGAGMFGLAWAVVAGITQINSGVDPIVALRFTRWPIMLYASGFVGFSLLFSNFLLRIAGWWRKVLLFLGCHSYVIYLAHTLVLRAIFEVL